MEAVLGGKERAGWPLIRISLALALCICIALNPQAHLIGRFWAEEGTDFFENLLGASPLAAVSYIYKGTLQLTSNLSVWFAGVVSIEYAPLITTWVGTVAVLNLAFLFALWGRSNGIDHWSVLLGLAAFLVGGISSEIISNSTNLQWVFSFLVLVIAFLPAEEISSRKTYTGMIVLLGGLSGVPSCMMAPIFMIRAYTERSRVHFGFSIILGACAVLQLFLIRNADTGERNFSVDILEMIYITAVRPIASLLLSPKGAALAMTFAVEHASEVVLYGAAVVVVIGALAFVIRSQLRTDKAVVLTLIAAWFLVTMLNLFGSLVDKVDPKSGIGGGRYYAFASLCTLMVVLLVSKANAYAIPATKIMLAWLIVINAGYAVATHPLRRYSAVPTWQSQLDSCRVNVDSACELAIWPNDPDKNDWVVVIEKSQLD